MKRLTCLLGALLLLGSWTNPAGAAPRPYKLAESSQFQTGCFTLCDCAIVSSPLLGTFGLDLVAPGPLFDEYRVVDVRWFLSDPAPNVAITGSGTYRVGGEVAVQHQMVLDLSVAGGPVQRFDSGLLTTTNGFPAIDIRVPLHGDSACFDTVLVIQAAPAPLTATGVENTSAEGVLSVRTSSANPFREHADLVIHVSDSGPTAIEVMDVQGRLVRRWSWAERNPGDHPFTWDGRTASGEEAPTGLYLVRARHAGRTAVARLVRLR
jgi:FlgD Ig-like domain